MDEVSRDLEKAEVDASHPTRVDDAPLAHSRTSSSLGSISSSSSSEVEQHRPEMNRMQTFNDLERHPTALSRIATQRSQHSATVGASLRSRVSKKPLPPFGAGKPFPPPLPSREEYVVEFDGPDDPLHPQNWPTKRK
jgi:MFS transporter, DHA1 family, multidrug resistance protein